MTRLPNNTIAMPPAPPTFGFTFTNAFPGMVFTNPVCMAAPPGDTNRLFILEKRGRVVVITNLAAPTRSVFLDLTARVTTTDTVNDERGLLGIAFHPGYATNRYLYLFYTGNTNTVASGLHDRLSRFRTSETNPNLGDPASELPLLAQYDEANNHNGGDLHFGPDGYLYVAVGDEGGANDAWANSQRITKDFFSGILRLDVDKRPGNLPPNPHPSTTTNYLVPADNPFVGAASFNGSPVNPANVRTEFWAVGLRNPWRMAFDSMTGTLYSGDVGQSTREEINIIQKGGNYGWNYLEGFFQRTNSAQIPAGFVPTPPIIDYPRGSGYSVTGGRVYRGQRISQLHGAYLYGDYGSGRVWALRHSGTNVTQNQQLFANPIGGPFSAGGISAFGTDPATEDILYVDLKFGTNSVINRIVYTTNFTGVPFPPTLADSGVFANLNTLTPHSGVVAYDLNLPFWSDYARKSRWFSIPNTNLDMTFSPAGNWLFPTGTVWVKHFALELTNGVPASARRLETRLLVQGANGGYGITYRWGDSTTNASLVPEAGLDETFVVYNPNGSALRTQTWRYPSRVECLQCHTPAAGFALGFSTAQLNRGFNYGGAATNQIAAFRDAGYFSNTVAGLYTLPALAHPTNSAVSLEYRARSWLAANCSACHLPGGTQMALWDARSSTPTYLAGIVDGPLANETGPGRVIAPGSLVNSAILTRISTIGAGRMPPIASSQVDTQAVALLSAWITNDLPSYQTYAAWQLARFGSTNSLESMPESDPDEDMAENANEYLTGTDPLLASSVWKVEIVRSNADAVVRFPQVANRGFEIQSNHIPDNPASWVPLDVPANAPFFSVSNRAHTVPEALQNTNRFYRARVFTP